MDITAITVVERFSIVPNDFPGAIQFQGGYAPHDVVGLPTSVAIDKVLQGFAKSADLTRVQVTARATVAPPSPYAGTYDPSSTLLVFPADVAAGLIAAGEAMAA